MRKTGFLALTATAACFLLAACGGSGDSSSTAAQATAAAPTATMGATAPAASGAAKGDSVDIKNFAYAPADLTVAKGTKLTFTNEDSTNHTATSSDQGGFDTGTIEHGQTKTVTLDQPGTFSYVCSFHPFMHGTVTVQP